MTNSDNRATDDAEAIVDAAKISPTAVFDRPVEVVRHPQLSPDEKLEILEQWQADETALQIADDEGMSGGQPAQLDEVLRAKLRVRSEAGLPVVEDVVPVPREA